MILDLIPNQIRRLIHIARNCTITSVEATFSDSESNSDYLNIYLLEPNEKVVFELNMLRGPHSRSFAYFVGEGCPFLAFLQNLGNERSPDRFVELLASKLTYLFLGTLRIEELYFADSLLFCVSQLYSSV